MIIMPRGVLIAGAFLMQILVAYGYIYEDIEYLDAEESKNFENLEGAPSTTREDNPRLTSIPETDFNCNDYGNGYYADPYTNCQVYHFCSGAKKISFLCSPGTIFDEQEKSCNWSVDVECLSLQERSKTSSKTVSDSRHVQSTQTPKRKHEPVKPPNYEEVISINGAFNQNQRTTTPRFNHPNTLAVINKKTTNHDVVIPEKINDLEVKQIESTSSRLEDHLYRSTPSTERSSMSTSTSTYPRNLDHSSKIPQSTRRGSGSGRRRTTERNTEINLARTTSRVFENYPMNTPLKNSVATRRFENTKPSFKVTTPNILETQRRTHGRRIESKQSPKNEEINQEKAFSIAEQTPSTPRGQLEHKLKGQEKFTTDEGENYSSFSTDKNENTPLEDLNVQRDDENKEIEASLKKPIKEVDIEEGNIDTTTIGVTRAASATVRGRIRYNKAKVVTHRTESRVVPDLPSVEIRRSTIRTNSVRKSPNTRNQVKGVQVIRKRPVTVKESPPPALTTTTENLDTTLFSEITDSTSQTSQTQSVIQKRRSTLFTPRFFRDRTTEKPVTSSRKPLFRSRPGGFRPVLDRNERKITLKRREKVKMKQKPLKNENITTTVTTFNLEDRNTNIFDLNDLIRNSEKVEDGGFMQSIVEAKRGLNSFNSENNRITLSSMIDNLRGLGHNSGRNTKEVKTIYDVNDFLSPSENPKEDLIQHHIVEAKKELDSFTGQSTNIVTQIVTSNKPTSTTELPIKITTEKNNFKSRRSELEKSRNDQLRRRKYKPTNKIIQATYLPAATTPSHSIPSPRYQPIIQDSIRNDPQLKGLFDVNDILEKPAVGSLNKGFTSPTPDRLEIGSSTEINVVTSRTVLKSSSSRKFRPRPATKRITFKPAIRRTTKISPVQKDKTAIISDNSNRISLPIPKTGSLNLGTTKKNSTKSESSDQYEFEIFPANNYESFDLNSGTPDMSFLLSYFGDVEVPSEVGSVLKYIRPSNSKSNNKDTRFLETPSPTSNSASYSSLFNLGEGKKSLDEIVQQSSNGYTKLDVDNALERKRIREVSTNASKNNTKLSSKISNESSGSKTKDDNSYPGLDINELLSAANHLVYFEPFKNETVSSTTRRPRKKHRQKSQPKFSSKKKQPESLNTDVEDNPSDTSFVYRGNIANIGKIINELLQSEHLPRLSASLSSSNT